MPLRLVAATLIILTFCPDRALAASLDGAVLQWPWALPFAGILLTIAAGPLLFAKLWHHHYGKFALGWSIAVLLPMAIVFGFGTAAAALVHAALAEYMTSLCCCSRSMWSRAASSSPATCAAPRQPT
jgi:hypothetical protein